MADKAIALVESHPFLVEHLKERDEAFKTFAERKSFVELHMKNFEEDIQKHKKEWWLKLEEWLATQPFAPPGFKPGGKTGLSVKNGALIVHGHDDGNSKDCGTDHTDIMSIISKLLKN